MVAREGFGAWASSSQASYPPQLTKPSESYTHSANVDLGVRHLTTFAHSLVFDGKFRQKKRLSVRSASPRPASSRTFRSKSPCIASFAGLTHLVVSLNRGTLIYTPKNYNPYYKDPQRGTPNFGKHHTSVFMRRCIFFAELKVGRATPANSGMAWGYLEAHGT